MGSLGQSRKTLESFQSLKSEFTSFYMGMIVSTFGEGLAGQIDLKNLSTFIENQVAFEAANVKQVYDTFARRFGTQANARTQRFASSTRTFNYFVTGFTYEKELSLYSAQAQSFYEWVI